MRRFALSFHTFATAVIIVAASLCAIQATAAEPLETKAFRPGFRTLKVQDPENMMKPPVIRLGTNDRLLFSFDQIGDDIDYDLRYRLIHCNADWTESRLLDSEITPGFNEAEAWEDAAFSSNTFVHYVNYQIELPNDNISPLVSGNYILQVYDETPESPIVQFRFMVSEASALVGGEASSRTDHGFNSEWQQLSLALLPGAAKIRDPYSDIILTVTQNGRTDNMVTLTTPMKVTSDRIVYDHLPSLIFPAGNEFRRFETVRADYPGMHVDSTRYEDSCYHAWLSVDRPRNTSGYSYDQTQFGRFTIDEYNSTDPNLGADYIVVHFALETPRLYGNDVYVDGEMTGHQFSERNRMDYNEQKQRYELSLPLKQGSYNYQYLAMPQGNSTALTTPLEGNKYETVNEYFIAAYYRKPGARADRLIATATLYSGK